MSRFMPLLAGLCAFAQLASCSTAGSEPDCYADAASCIDPSGTDHRYVVSEVSIPADADAADAIAIDLDGDGEVDNALGQLLGTFEVQPEVDYRLATGDTIVLMNLRSTSTNDAAQAGLWLYAGADPDPAPCSGSACGRHLTGSASFSIDSESPTDAAVAGTVQGGVFQGGPAPIEVRLALSSGAPLVLPLHGARIEATVGSDGLVDGVIAGAVHEDDLDTAVLPAVRDALAEVIAVDCPYSGPDCCVSGSAGEFMLSLLDDCSPGSTTCDCAVSIEELSGNDLIRGMLRSDVDLLDNTGEYAPGMNGDNESISLAFGFSATTAEFSTP